MIPSFSADTFLAICDSLGAADNDLMKIIKTYGYPPMWTRPNSFETLVHIILEQQVSLASALSALNKLRDAIKVITPRGVLALSDEALKACYFSRQKSSYVRHLAQTIIDGKLDLMEIRELTNEEIRETLKKIKGIGDWTIDVYLMFVLQRSDIFPIGDLAAVNALRRIKNMPRDSGREILLDVTTKWQPYRTVATMILWHYYLSVRAKPAQTLTR